MYFYKERGKQTLDLKGDLIITTAKTVVTARSPSCAPRRVLNANKSICLPLLDTRRKKLMAIYIVACVIWNGGKKK